MGRWPRGCCDGRILLRIGQLPVLSPEIKAVICNWAGYSPAPLFHQQTGKRLPAALEPSLSAERYVPRGPRADNENSDCHSRACFPRDRPGRG